MSAEQKNSLQARLATINFRILAATIIFISFVILLTSSWFGIESQINEGKLRLHLINDPLAAALQNNDPGAAATLLASLGSLPDIAAVAVFRLDRTLLASFERNRQEPPGSLQEPRPAMLSAGAA